MFWIVVLGIATGMRAFTPLTVFCWFAWFALIPSNGETFWTANIVAVIVFTALALSEYWLDTLPRTPRRTRWVSVLARLALAILVGVMLASIFVEPIAGGVVFGVIGALMGTYGGYAARMHFARRVGRDLPVALWESVLALALSVVAMERVVKSLLWMTHVRYPG